MEEFITTLIGTLFIIFIFFLIFREFWCWYWKINERLYLLKRIESHLKKISEHYSKANGVSTIPEHELIGQVVECEKCSAKLVVEERDVEQGYLICPYCGVRIDLVVRDASSGIPENRPKHEKK